MRDVKDKTVAVGSDSEHPSILNFVADCIDDCAARTLAVYLNSGSTRNMFHQIYDNAVLPFDGDLLKVRLMNAFDGISIDNYAKKLKEEQRHLGGVVEEEEGYKAMVVKDNKGGYVLVDIDPDYVSVFQVSEFFECPSSLKGLREFSYNWHEVMEN